jgi:hypothetical protein
MRVQPTIAGGRSKASKSMEIERMNESRTSHWAIYCPSGILLDAIPAANRRDAHLMAWHRFGRRPGGFRLSRATKQEIWAAGNP